jgi:SAM-dependent methyltransferase
MIRDSIHYQLKLLSDNFEKKLILNLGCGDKRYNEIFEVKNKIISMDVHVSGHDIKNKLADIFYDGKTFPFEDSYFDVIFSTEVIEHVEDLDSYCKESYRVLKPGGLLIISTPFFWGEHEIPFDFRRLTSFGIKKLFVSYGYKVKSFLKLVTGVNAVKTLMLSEMHNSENRKKNNFIIKKFILFFFRTLFYLLNKFYNFERVYLTNFIVLSK